MASVQKFVVSAYGSWAKAATNPSTMVLSQLKNRSWDGFSMVGLEVPVVSQDLFATVEKNLLAHQPAFWISIGVAPGSPHIRAEMVGMNWLDFGVADNSGFNPKGVPIVKNGPVAYNAEVPNHEIVAKLKAADIPAEVSYFAGTHMCNQMLYTTRHLVEQHKLHTRCGFFHVPLTPAHVANPEPGEQPRASMGLNMMTSAIEHAILHMIAEVKLSDGKR